MNASVNLREGFASISMRNCTPGVALLVIKYTKRFSDFIYAGWISNDPKTNESMISNTEMRTYLLTTSERIRLHIFLEIRGSVKE